MPLQLRLVGQNAIQTAIPARIVDLAFFDLQQILERRGWVPALLDGQFAARRAETMDRQQGCHARPRHIGGLLIEAPFEEAIQFQALPQFQSEKARADLPSSFQPHFVQQHTPDLRIIRRRRHMRREQLQRLRIALFVEDFNRCQPAGLRRTVPLAQVTERFLPRAIRRAHRFDQRPIGVILTVLAAVVRPQKHSELIVSWPEAAFKRVGLHYIAILGNQHSADCTYLSQRPQNSLKLSK